MGTFASDDKAAPEYLTPKQVASLLQIPETTLAVWRSTGRVRLAFTKVGRAVRYRRADVEALLAGNRHACDTH